MSTNTAHHGTHGMEARQHTQHPQADRKAPHQENATRPTTLVNVLTQDAAFATLRKAKAKPLREHPKVGKGIMTRAEKAKVAKHLDNPHVMSEAPRLQETPEPLHVESGLLRDIVQLTRTPAPANTTTHPNASIGQHQVADAT